MHAPQQEYSANVRISHGIGALYIRNSILAHGATTHSATQFVECSERQHNRINNRIHAPAPTNCCGARECIGVVVEGYVGVDCPVERVTQRLTRKAAYFTQTSPLAPLLVTPRHKITRCCASAVGGCGQAFRQYKDIALQLHPVICTHWVLLSRNLKNARQFRCFFSAGRITSKKPNV
ncbi:hypothetical protein J6590_008575 [Homalodisca vitripennis]|nr:hypothetical protein J6590_008575 [Homalodisca vitripennis]